MLQALQRHIQRNTIVEQGAGRTRTGQGRRETRTGQARSLQVSNPLWIILILLCVLISGCGSNVPGVGGQAQNTPTTQPALTPSPTNGQQAQNCGEVDTILNGKALDATKAKIASNCFWQAYQKCQIASLTLKVHSLDTGANHVFTTKNTNGKCAITDTVTHYIVPNNLKTTTTYTCSGVTMQAGSLRFINCGSLGTIVVPA